VFLGRVPPVFRQWKKGSRKTTLPCARRGIRVDDSSKFKENKKRQSHGQYPFSLQWPTGRKMKVHGWDCGGDPGDASASRRRPSGKIEPYGRGVGGKWWTKNFNRVILTLESPPGGMKPRLKTGGLGKLATEALGGGSGAGCTEGETGQGKGSGKNKRARLQRTVPWCVHSALGNAAKQKRGGEKNGKGKRKKNGGHGLERV